MGDLRKIIKQVAIDALNNGLCVNPPRNNSKAPLGESDQNHNWDRFKSQLPTLEYVLGWYEHPKRTGVGVFCGKVSGGLEVLDFDDRETYFKYKELAEAAGLGDLVRGIEAGYLEFTPNGVHWLYRCSVIGGNVKLATRPKLDSEKNHDNDNTKTLIETRGEGGYCIIAPSYGPFNPVGPYVLQSGSFATITTITPEELHALHDIARVFNVSAQENISQNFEMAQKKSIRSEIRPGDDFNARVTWEEILLAHGWTKIFTRGTTTYWRRPGKYQGISATTNHADSDLLYVFSSSTAFEPNRGYNKFSAFSILKHGGDLSAAASELSRRGFGTAKQQSPSKSTPPAETANDPIAPDLLTDSRVSLYFSALFISVIRYCPAFNKWIVFDGTRWHSEAPGGPYPFIRKMIKALYKIAHSISDDNKRVEYLKNLITLESHKRQNAILSAAQFIPQLIIYSNEFDMNPMLLNVKNGTLDLSSGQLRPHNAKDYLTKIIDIEYCPESECPEFIQFLNRIFSENQEFINYVQRFIGYCLTGRTDEQVILFMHGEGANGKTTLANVVEVLLCDLAITASADLLMQRDNRNASNDLAALRGARLVKVAEFDESDKISEAQLKTLTGEDRIACRFLYGEFFQYRPTYKIILLGNHKPSIRGRDYGIWRRIHLLPFRVIIPKHERDPNLFRRLLKEMQGILAWAVQGCLAWQERGLDPPDEVLQEVEHYRRSEDVFMQWFDECCITGCEYQSSASALIDSFVRFTNLRHMTTQKFGRLLAEQGFTKVKSGNIYWRGIGLLET